MTPTELALAKTHAANSRHIYNLRRFVADKARFSLLAAEDRDLILRQLELMEGLDIVLEARMRRRNIPV